MDSVSAVTVCGFRHDIGKSINDKNFIAPSFIAKSDRTSSDHLNDYKKNKRIPINGSSPRKDANVSYNIKSCKTIADRKGFFLLLKSISQRIGLQEILIIGNLDFGLDNKVQNLLSNFVILRQKLVSMQSPQKFELESSLIDHCKQLKYYKPRNNGANSTEPHILKFADKPFSTNSLPSGIPEEISNMKLEANRLKSFRLADKPQFEKFCSFIKPEDLANDGFFYMLSEDKVKCAFCLGVLVNWEPQECPRDAHRLHFSTCPWVLQIDVGNVPITESKKCEEFLSVPQQCSENSENDQIQHDISLLNNTSLHSIVAEPAYEPMSIEMEQIYQSNVRSISPVAPDVAEAACSKNADTNLDLLMHSVKFSERNYPPKYPDFTVYSERLKSNKRGQHLVPADLLADAGFFTEQGTSTCYQCGLSINDWLTIDNPWIEHCRWSPRCAHLLLNRGYQFIKASRAAHPPYSVANLPQQQSDRMQQPNFSFETSGLIDYRIEQRHFKARDDFPACLSIKQVGFEVDDVKTALLLQLKGCGDDFKSGELFINGVMQVEEARTSAGLTAREFFEKKDEQIKQAKREPRSNNKDDVDWTTCKVCMDKIIDITLLDCGHLCCCSICAKNLETCPVCRSPIRAVVYTNL